jgi:hypothetical protein
MASIIGSPDRRIDMKSNYARDTILILWMGVSLIAAAAQNDQAKKIEEGKKILEKWMAAQGGRDRLAQIRDIQYVREMKIIPAKADMTNTVYIKGATRVRMESKVMGRVVTSVLSGETGWLTNPSMGSVSDMPKPLMDAMKKEAEAYEVLLHPEKYGAIFTYEGRKTIEGIDYILLNHAAKDGSVVTHYIDPDTFLESINVSVVPNSGTETYISDYRNVDGLKVSFFSKTKKDGTDVTTSTLKEIHYNTNLEDSLFNKPSAPQP